VVRFGLLRGKGSAQGLGSNVEEMGARPKIPASPSALRKVIYWLLGKTQKLVLEQSVCVQAAIDRLQLWLQEIVVLWCCTRREQSRTVAGPKGELSRVTLAP
jgi:hypothetical protein